MINKDTELCTWTVYYHQNCICKNDVATSERQLSGEQTSKNSSRH